jgi:hypothetical protein
MAYLPGHYNGHMLNGTIDVSNVNPTSVIRVMDWYKKDGESPSLCHIF